MDSEELELEHLHYKAVLKHFSKYEEHVHKIMGKHLKDFQSLSPDDRQLIDFYPKKIEKVQECARANQCILNKMISAHIEALQDEEEFKEADDEKSLMKNMLTKERAQENIRSLLRQIVRDWSEDGAEERNKSYGVIMEALEKEYPDSRTRNRLNVLVPGAGLGRLVHDICQKGFNCQGNEFSLFMLLPSEWILNSGIGKSNQATIFPWITPFSNQLSIQDQTRPISFPDVTPGLSDNSGEMSMTAGDFLEVYEPDGEWDAVVTCFFLDTAKNVVEYVRRIYGLLRAGGIWINHGPLLYHFEGSMSDCSIELGLDEVKLLATRIGFTIESESMTRCGYTSNSLSMHQTIYNCSFMVLRKPL